VRKLIAVLLLAALLMTGCSAQKWEPLAAGQMDKALMMEEKLVGTGVMEEHGLLYDHGDNHDYNGYADWWNQGFREFLQAYYGDGIQDALKDLEERAGENETPSYRNTATRNRYANLYAKDSDDYHFITSPNGLFQAYRTSVLTKLLYPEKKQTQNRKEDPIRVLFVDGSRFIAVDREGAMTIYDADRQALVSRAKDVWTRLTAGYPDQFVLVSDPSVADVIIDMYLHYAPAGAYGRLSVYSSHLYLYALNLSTGDAATGAYENIPGTSVKARVNSSRLWMGIPDIEESHVPIMDTILSWYPEKTNK